MTSGADVKTGDVVMNLTTGEVGKVIGTRQDGRVLVLTGETHGARWERWNIERIES